MQTLKLAMENLLNTIHLFLLLVFHLQSDLQNHWHEYLRNSSPRHS